MGAKFRYGDIVVRKEKHSCDVRFVEEVNPAGVLLVNGVEDVFYDTESMERLYDEYELLCEREDRKDSQYIPAQGDELPVCIRSEKDFSYDIILHLQGVLDRFSGRRWSSDDCKPKFTLSLGGRETEGESDKMLITIEHGSRRFTNTVFPRSDSYYGYDGIFEMMEDMYNRTM